MRSTAANLVPAGAEQIARAKEILRGGGLVAFPTETVYGLGADATSERAVASIFEAKARPRFNPLIVHVMNFPAAAGIVAFTPAARRLAQAFWPGPLTLVLPRTEHCGVSLLVSAGLDTVAIRAPAHPVAQSLLAMSDLPIAAPSANRSGRISPTTAAHVAEEFGGRIDLILDGGAAILGIESTVIGFEGERPVLLRPGAISRQEIERVAGPAGYPSDRRISSPGQLASHYAPRAPVRVNALEVRTGEALLAFGPDALDGACMTRNLSASGNLMEAAANLFAALRELDASGAAGIAAMPIPENGLGEAINDRLRRAAAPRIAG